MMRASKLCRPAALVPRRGIASMMVHGGDYAPTVSLGWTGEDLLLEDVFRAPPAGSTIFSGRVNAAPFIVETPKVKARVERPAAQAVASGLGRAEWTGDDLSMADLWPSLTAPPAWSGEDLRLEDVWSSPPSTASLQAKARVERPAAQVVASGLGRAEWTGDDLSMADLWPSLTAMDKRPPAPGRQRIALSLPLAGARRQPSMPLTMPMYKPAPYEWGYDRVGRGYDVCRVGLSARRSGAEAAMTPDAAASQYTPAAWEWGYDRVGRGYDVCRLGVSGA